MIQSCPPFPSGCRKLTRRGRSTGAQESTRDKRHVCCVTQQCSRHVSCVTEQTFLLCDTAEMSAVRHDKHVCYKTQQTVRECIRACKRGAKREGARLLVGDVVVHPTVTIGSHLGHPWVTLGSTVRQHWLNLGHPRGQGCHFQ